MNIIDRLILLIYTLCLAVFSIALMLFPYEQFDFLSLDSMQRYLGHMKGNYSYTIVGLAFLLVSIRFFMYSISGRRKEKRETYLVRHTNYGELKISSLTIEGLVQSVVDKFSGVKNIKTTVNIVEGIITILLKGEVSPEINIPETTIELQNKVKEHVEKCTGVEVSEVQVEISNVTASTRVVK